MDLRPASEETKKRSDMETSDEVEICTHPKHRYAGGPVATINFIHSPNGKDKIKEDAKALAEFFNKYGCDPFRKELKKYLKI